MSHAVVHCDAFATSGVSAAAPQEAGSLSAPRQPAAPVQTHRHTDTRPHTDIPALISSGVPRVKVD